MPIRSQHSQLFIPELEQLRAQRHRFLYIKQSRMSQIFDVFLHRARSTHHQYGLLNRRHLFIDPTQVKQRRDLLYLLLRDLRNWNMAAKREAATRTVRGKTNLNTDEERHARNIRLAKRYDVRLSTPRHKGRPLSLARHTDAFLSSLPSGSLLPHLYSNRQGWRPLYEQYKIWVAEEISIACEALDDFIGHLVTAQDQTVFMKKYGKDGGDRILSAFAGGSAYSEEEVVAAIVAAAKRIGTTDAYRVNSPSVERILKAWSAYRKTPIVTRRMKGRKPNHLNFLIFAQNLGL